MADMKECADRVVFPRPPKLRRKRDRLSDAMRASLTRWTPVAIGYHSSPGDRAFTGLSRLLTGCRGASALRTPPVVLCNVRSGTFCEVGAFIHGTKTLRYGCS